jgi:hypothetical protein
MLGEEPSGLFNVSLQQEITIWAVSCYLHEAESTENW